MIAITPAREVFLRIGSFEIRWYGVLYVIAFAIAWWLLPRLGARRGITLTADQWLIVLAAGMAGVICGGRLGYALLYEPQFFADNPLKILAISEGGMAFHGGLVGVAIAVWLVARRYRVPTLALLDVVVIPVAIGLSLGRIGNFINGELVGTPTMLPWGVLFPGEDVPRHPVQLYGALKNISLALLCTWYFFHTRRFVVGRTTALFLIGYGLARLAIGFVREIDGWSVTVGSQQISEGQVLSAPLIVIGCYLWFSTRSRTPRRLPDTAANA